MSYVEKNYFGLFLDLVLCVSYLCLPTQTADINVHLKDTGKEKYTLEFV